jgi:hypothetical protein
VVFNVFRTAKVLEEAALRWYTDCASQGCWTLQIQPIGIRSTTVESVRRDNAMRTTPILKLAIMLVLALGLAGSAAFAAGPSGPPASPADIDLHTWIDANRLATPVVNMGTFALNPGHGTLEYPRGSGNYLLYSAGIWVGAKVGGQIRVTSGGYDPEFRPGIIYPGGTWDPYTDPVYHVYKIVRGDTASSDYLAWPFQHGAPATAGGRPLLLGDQTLWCVYHDADPAYHTAPEGSTPPLGLEIQQLAYAFDRRVAYGNVIFLEFKLINKLAFTLDSTYVAIWSDPDVGGYIDDLVGCDPSLGLGFAYNGDNADTEYGSRPPCVGFDLLKGPRGDAGEPLGIRGFRGYTNGLDPFGAPMCYRYMKGLAGDGDPLVDPTSGNPTTFEFSGDPVAGTGWLDHTPCDRRFIMGSGPFTMAPGDTQEIAVAIVAAAGSGRLASVALMKSYDQMAQAAFDAGFAGWFPPPSRGTVVDAATGGPRPDGKTPAELEGGRDAESAALGTFAVTAGPNPALEGVTIRASAPVEGGVGVRILDSAGRLVRALDGTAKGGADVAVTWDGRDDLGRRVPAGIYFIDVTGAAGSATAKVVLVR